MDHYSVCVGLDYDIIPNFYGRHEGYNHFMFQVQVIKTVSPCYDFRFCISREYFIAKEHFVRFLTGGLRRAELPQYFENHIVDAVFNFGLRMINDHNPLNVLPIDVTVYVLAAAAPAAAAEGEDAITQAAISESMQLSQFKTVPAASSSIQALEKVKLLDGDDLMRHCMICLEKLFVGGIEMIRMPCSHIYHGDCIGQWLQKSNSCPLCRFSLPPC